MVTHSGFFGINANTVTITLQAMARRRGILALMFCVALVLMTSGTHAELARQTVSIVVPYTVGSEPDRVARILADELDQRWHKSVVVENKEGASGLLGIRDVMRARPDGGTLLMVGPSYTMNASLLNNPAYDPATSLAPVIMCCAGAFVLAIHPSLPIQNLGEFVTYVHSHPNVINYASPGVGTPFHMAMELFANTANLKVTHIPYKGFGGALTDLVGGHVNAMFLPLVQGAALAKAGKVRLLAIPDDARSQVAPDIPTFIEQGYRGMDVRIWIGLLAPPATPSYTIDQVNHDIADFLRSERGLGLLAKQALTPAVGTPQAFADFVAKDTERWRRIVAAQHIQKH